MGDIADAMLDGVLCQGCGAYVGISFGSPRWCRACAPPSDRMTFAEKAPAAPKPFTSPLYASKTEKGRAKKARRRARDATVEPQP